MTVAAARGHFEIRTLRVLSMGLALSVFIAHMLALEIVRRAVDRAVAEYDAWVDNLIALTNDENAIQGILERFASISKSLPAENFPN